VVRRIDRDEQDRRRTTFLYEALETRGPEISSEQAHRNAAYIAAASPDVVAALVRVALAARTTISAMIAAGPGGVVQSEPAKELWHALLDLD
jgi:hypothetical protein